MPQTATQPHIPGLSRADRKPTVPRLSEKSLQAHIRQALGHLGYASAEVGASRKYLTCPACGNTKVPPARETLDRNGKTVRRGNLGNSEGVPDLLVWLNTGHISGFPPVAILLEVKADGGKASPEQQLLVDAGRSQIVRSVVEAVEAVKIAEDRMMGYAVTVAQRERVDLFIKQNSQQNTVLTGGGGR